MAAKSRFAIAIAFVISLCSSVSLLALGVSFRNVNWHWTSRVKDLLWRKCTHCASDRESNASEPVVQGDGMMERGTSRTRSRRAVGVLSGGFGGGCKINFIYCISSPFVVFYSVFLLALAGRDGYRTNDDEYDGRRRLKEGM